MANVIAGLENSCLDITLHRGILRQALKGKICILWVILACYAKSSMHGIRLNKKQEEERRINAVKDVSNGISIKDVARKYDVSIFTVYKWLRREDLSAKPRKGFTKIKDEGKLVEILERSPRDLGLNYDFWTLKLIAYVIEREFGVKYNQRSLGPVLKKLGFKYKKGKGTYVRD